MSRFPTTRWGVAALTLIGSLALAPGAMGQNAQSVSARVGQRTPRAFPQPVDGQIKLSLEEAISLALANNEDVNVTINAAAATDFELVASEGIFDPLLTGFANRNHQDSPASNQLSGAFLVVQDTYNYGAQVQQLAPWGGTFTLGTSGGRFSTNSQFYNISGINPSYNAGLTASFSQPLLRNFGKAATEWQIYIAKNTRDASYQQYVRSIQTTVNNVEQAYWDLVYASQNLDVKNESLRIAQELNRITKIKIDVGSLAPIDITQTEVGVAQAEQDIITAEGQVGDALDRLRRQLNIDPELGNVPIVATDDVHTQSMTVDLRAGTLLAIEKRPEVIAAAYQTQSDEVRLEYWKNQILPGVNLVGSYGNIGLDGTVHDADGNVIVVNGLGDAYQQVWDRKFKNWSIGVNVSYPILNRYAKGQRGAAQYLLESDRAILTTTQQNVVVDVRAAARAIDTAQRQIVAASKGRELAEKNLDAEKKKFDNGMSTTFQVNQIQRDLSAARTTELQALVVYRKAVAAYHFSVADNLEWKKIGIEGIPDTSTPPIPSPWPSAAVAKP
ncbi:MAG TPA: TolC family protein [Thermoanaerobaculia bacterium]|jgi:outer membrane protein TolC